MSIEEKVSKPIIAQLFPGTTTGELREVDANLTRYATLVYRIYRRVRDDPEAYAALKECLTDQRPDDSMKEPSAVSVRQQ